MTGGDYGWRAHPVFASGGDIDRHLIAVDWSATPLGPPESWPRSLVTIVRMMLASRFSMWLAWGPQLTFLCNDAYRRDTLGSKFPWALGRPAQEVWSEAWAEAGPRIESVLTSGTATWDESLQLFLERSGFPEETYHTFSYSPLADDDGQIAGMLCVVTEDTGRVIAARRIALLTALGSAMASAATEAEVYAASERVLGFAGNSLPFALLYRFDDGGSVATLTAAAGAAAGTPVAPRHLTDTTDEGGAWPLTRLVAGETVLLSDLGARFAEVPRGAWELPPTQAYLVPLSRPGTEPLGLFVAGLNPHVPFDEEYRTFLHLLSGQLAASVATARAHDEGRARAEEILELDAAKTAFFTNVSHELRTPLTLLLGPAEALLANPPTGVADPVQRERVEVIQRNAERLLMLVNTLLDFSRLEAGRADPVFEPVDLVEYTAELTSMFASAVEEAGLELRVDPEVERLPVLVDREMWAKIVLNLLSNAIKFTFTGSITVRVRATTGADAGFAELSVIDTGVGVPAHDQPRLFERFGRVAGGRARSHEGTGIGLALVAELAAVHGGSAAVDSAPGRGSTFTVRIPLAPPDTPPAPAQTDRGDAVRAHARGHVQEAQHWIAPEAQHWIAPEPRERLAETPATPRPRVLVVDDNADMRDYLAGLLAQRYHVLTATDGEDALEQVGRDVPDLVLTDVMMPRLDGFGLIAALRSQPQSRDVPVIMLSARAGEDAAVEGLDAGANDYLVKPFTARELVARVRANLELDRVRRLAAELETSRSLLLQAQHLANVSSWELDSLTGRITGSPELFAQLGVEADDDLDLASALVRFAHPEDRDVIAAAVEEGFTGKPFNVEFRMVGAAGVRHFRALGEVAAGEPAAPRLRGSLQDITAQRAAEAQLVAAAAISEASAREHHIATELQRSLLPQRTVSPEGLEIATYYRAGVAGTQVGGDWYDVIPLVGGQTAVVLGDVMGSGITAASVMGQLRTTLRAYANLGLLPGRILELLDVTVRDLAEHQIATCFLGVYDPGSAMLVYANAGHLPPVLVAPGKPARLLPEPSSPPLGAGPLHIGEEQLFLEPGQLLALYTDGLVEHRRQDLDTGIAALCDLLARHVATENLDALPEQLADTLLPDGPDDDVTVLLARHTPTDSAISARTLLLRQENRAARDARVFTAEALRVWDAPASMREDAQLLVSELVTNALLHGAPPIELALRYSTTRLRLSVTDSKGRAPDLRAPDDTDPHGRGLRLVQTLASAWGVTSLANGKMVWCDLVRTPSGRELMGRKPAGTENPGR